MPSAASNCYFLTPVPSQRAAGADGGKFGICLGYLQSENTFIHETKFAWIIKSWMKNLISQVMKKNLCTEWGILEKMNDIDTQTHFQARIILFFFLSLQMYLLGHFKGKYIYMYIFYVISSLTIVSNCASAHLHVQGNNHRHICKPTRHPATLKYSPSVSFWNLWSEEQMKTPSALGDWNLNPWASSIKSGNRHQPYPGTWWE